MAKPEELEVGQRWAYRAHNLDSLVEVEVLAVGTAAPARTKIGFVGSTGGEVEAWVPPTRLKVIWAQHLVFGETESKWRALTCRPESDEEGAVQAIVAEFLGPAAHTNGLSSESGTICIVDEELVDVFIGGGLDLLVEGAESIMDDRGVHYGWEVAVAIAQQVCAVKAQRVMAYVHREEERDKFHSLSRATIHGQAWSSSTVGFPVDLKVADVMHPVWDVVRAWCGEPVASAADQLREARRDAARFEEFFANCLGLLDDADERAASWAMFQWAYPGASEDEWRTMIATEAATRRRWRKRLSPLGDMA